ncbi:hypothetical protein ACKWTF_016676 [Chironomus riparius]
MLRSVFLIFLLLAAVLGAPQPSSRILGGRNVFLGELPYQVSLRYWGTPDHFAGGVLLNTRWVLTTAHGVFIHPGNGIDIILGIIRVDTGESMRSSEIRVHPLFDNILLINDIATIRTQLVIELSSFVSPISLSPFMVGDGIIAHVSRWGALDKNATQHSVFLQKVDVSTGPCIDTKNMTFSAINHICAGNYEENQEPTVGICTTDVGGPLVLNNMLIGIPFYHDPRGCGVVLDGYMRILSYRGWIMANSPE